MRTGKRWMIGVLVLAVFGIGTMAQAQPPALVSPAEPIPRLPAVVVPPSSSQAPMLSPVMPPPPPAPATITTLPPAPPNGALLEGEHHEHEEHHGEIKESHKEAEEEDKHSAFIIEGDFLLMRPNVRGQDYAVAATNPNGGPLGGLRSVTGGYDAGFRVGTGYRLPGEGCEIVLDYTNFRTTGNNDVGAPAGGFVFPTLTHPSLVTQVAGAAAFNSITENIFDLEFAKRWHACSDVATDTVVRRVRFEGFGLRAGGEADYKVFEHLSVYGKGAVSMMTAKFHSDLSETANGQPVVNVSEKYNKVIPVLEMGAGLSYWFGNLRLSAGYEIVNWFGGFEGIDFADDVAPGKFNRRSGDLSFDGFVFRALWMF
jgi:hypothetical protein